MEVLERRVRGAEGEWWFRYTVSQDLPTLATDALIAGWDSQSLRLLAGEPLHAYSLDLGDLFEKAMLSTPTARGYSTTTMPVQLDAAMPIYTTETTHVTANAPPTIHRTRRHLLGATAATTATSVPTTGTNRTTDARW